MRGMTNEQTLFTIRESDAIGSDKFIVWIKNFNSVVTDLAKKYNANTIHHQDFLEQQKINKVDF